jgi:hypothetical protein
MVLRELTNVSVKVPRYGQYVQWKSKPTSKAQRGVKQPRGSFLKKHLISRRPLRLFVDEFIAGGKGYWYFKDKFYEADNKNLSEPEFLELCKGLQAT